jgi:hypothetical protein
MNFFSAYRLQEIKERLSLHPPLKATAKRYWKIALGR